MLDTGTAIDGALRRIPALRDVDELFGEGSVIAEGLKAGFGCCPDQALEFYALPHKDASVGATLKAQYDVRFEGEAKSPGRVDIFMGDGRWNISVRVTTGMKDDDIAAAVGHAWEMEPGFPFDVSVGDAASGQGNVVRLTAKNAGTVGNCLTPIYNWHDRLDYAPAGVEMFVQMNQVGAQDPVAPFDYAAVLGECCYCCIGMLYDDPVQQDVMIAYINDAWSCLKPQCFGHGYTYNTGTLGEVLGTFTNSPEVSRIAHCCDDPSWGPLKVAAYTSLSCCSTVDNPEMSIQGPNFGVLNCLAIPESCFQCFTFDEQEQLRQNGFVVTVPLVNGTGSLTSPMITNDITNNLYDEEGRLNSTWWNVNARRLAAATADSIAIHLNQKTGLGLYTKNTTIPPGIRGTNPRLILGDLRAWAKSNVGILFSEFDNIDKDITLKTDFERAPKCQGIPGKLWVDFVYRPPVRISNIIVNAKPAMLSNC
jgi:phage tail sheath gpL-like